MSSITPPIEKSESLRDRLKIETADLHERIEETSLMGRLMESDLTAAEYQLFLQLMYHFYAYVEKQLDGIAELEELLPDLNMRMKRRSLKKDLEEFSLEAAASQKLPLIQLPITNLSQAMGVMYVLEGSTLGGQFIRKELLKRPFLTEQTLQFFSHYGTEVGLFWRKFLKALELSDAERKVENDQVVNTAKATFEAMMNLMDKQIS